MKLTLTVGRKVVVSLVAISLTLALSAVAAEKMPADMAGEIGAPSGKIAFIRDKNIWTMNAHGGMQMKICEATNADGRLSWAPDGRRIAFTRSGIVDLKAPDMLGGVHKIYDIFIAYLDSADVGNTFFWRRLTNKMGGRDPEWSADGSTILFYQDMNANFVDASMPNYQVCTMNPDASNLKILRSDWENVGEFFIAPTRNDKGDVVFVHFVTVQQSTEQGVAGAFQPRGLAKLNENNFDVPLDSVRILSGLMTGATAPAWSPDGKWIAFVSNIMANPGIFITTPDFSEKYLVFEPPPGASLFTISPSFSPDSKWLTFATTDRSVWICDITGNGAKRLTDPGLDLAPTWSKATTKK